MLGGRYHVGSLIARGGMASVYLGTDTRLDRVVAIKIAHPEFSDDAEFVRRFIGEARSAARLSSPNVVSIYDQGSDGGLHYIAMEYVPGRTLREVLNERGRIGARESLGIMTGVLSGLAAAHQAGLAHRDVKPENVLINPTGIVKVADFGLARAVAGTIHTRGGMIIGTAAYLAPEQVAGGMSDARTDVYAAGIMLYELLTGVQPHTGESPLAVAYKHVHEVVPHPSDMLPGLSPALDTLVTMATSRDPDLRPADAEQFLRAIGDVRNGHGPGASGSYSGYPARPAADGGWPADSYPYQNGYGADGYGSAEGPAGLGAGSRPYGQAPYGDTTAEFGYQPWPGYETADSAYPTAPEYPADGWDLAPTVVGASALPSLSPQSAVIMPPAQAGQHARVNHTLIVPADELVMGYRDGDGRGGYGYHGGRSPARRHEPLLQRLLFSRRLIYLVSSLAVVVAIALIGWWLMSGQYTTLPQLRGVALTTAKTELQNLGLKSAVSGRRHSLLPRGYVISTSPASGARVGSGSPVSLIVSLGPLMIQVPNVSGQPLNTAEQNLRAANLIVGKVSRATSTTVPPGDVILTTPAAYSRWPQNKPVGITISAGLPLPNFVGQQVQAAAATAQAGGYTINAVADPTGSQPVNTIVSQSPSPGTPITPGEVVTIRYSPGPPGIQVPDVRGISIKQAIRALQQAGFQVAINQQGPGNIVGSYSPTGVQPKGSVITLNVGFFSNF